jgi:membrane protease YdiL (CAAX protease family)
MAPVTVVAWVAEGLLLGAGTLAVIGWLARGRWRGIDRLAPWPGSLAHVFLYLLAALSGVFALASALALVLAHVRSLSDTVKTLIEFAAQDGGMLGGCALYLVAYRQVAPESASPPILGGSPALVRGFTTFALSWPFVFGSTIASQKLFEVLGLPVVQQNVAAMFENLTTPALKITFGLVACVLAPAAEEFVFRAGIFRALRSVLPRWTAALLSGAAFGGAHWAIDRQAGATVIPLTVLGTLFALAYERTGRISTTIVAHGLFNLNTLLMMAAGINS